MSLDARTARFLRSVESGRWSRGRPEELWSFITEHKRTLMLGFTKALRVSKGFTNGGSKKPHRYQQATRGLFYNLADKDHMKALLVTFSRMSSMGALLKDRPGKYGLQIGEQRKLSSRHIPGQGTETLILACENGSFRAPNHKVYARNKEIREKAKREYRRRCSPIKQYTFLIQRPTEGKTCRMRRSLPSMPTRSITQSSSAC